MKKIILTLFGTAMIFSMVQCASTITTPDPKVMACKATCDTAYDECIKKAGKNEAKKVACDAARKKCYSDCESK